MSKVSDCISCPSDNTIDCSRITTALMPPQKVHKMGQSSSIYYELLMLRLLIKQYEHEVEKESAFALGLIAVKVIGQETDYSFLIFHCSLHNLFS